MRRMKSLRLVGLQALLQLERRDPLMQTVSFNPDDVLALLPLIESIVCQSCSEERLTDEIAWTAVACLAKAKLSRLDQAALDAENGSDLQRAS